MTERRETASLPGVMRILLAEDEIKAARHLKQGLEAEGYAVDVTHDGDEALWLSKNRSYDALVLDVMLPTLDGFRLVRILRREGLQTPVIFVTARGEVEDRVRGLDAGGDDYLVKPFSLFELLARLRALARRTRADLQQTLRVGDLELDLVSREARRTGQGISLSPREFALLELLMTASPRAVSKAAIMERVWDQHFDGGTNIVQVYVNYLRGKIEREPLPPMIHTVRGVGYALREAAG